MVRLSDIFTKDSVFSFVSKGRKIKIANNGFLISNDNDNFLSNNKDYYFIINTFNIEIANKFIQEDIIELHVKTKNQIYVFYNIEKLLESSLFGGLYKLRMHWTKFVIKQNKNVQSTECFKKEIKIQKIRKIKKLRNI